MLLFWEVCAVIIVFHFYHVDNWIFSSSQYLTYFSVVFGVGILCVPLLGLLSDVVLGRYKTIKYSIIGMWLAILLNGIVEVVYLIYGGSTDQNKNSVSNLILLVGVIASGSLLVNSLQFGVDQLMDAPSRQITSFISWFTWCYYLSDILSVLILDCGCIGAFSTVFIAVIVTVALCADILYNKDLVKEPTSRNPLKLIFKVLKYAATNKYPHARSAFSYWDQKKSRINLSKSKYGGPFTHEEVEDVKTFFRMLWILLIGSFFVGYFIVYADTLKFEIGRFQHNGLAGIIHTAFRKPVSCRDCLLVRSLFQASSLILLIGVPLFELLIYPILKNCFKFHCSMTMRFNLGMLFLLLNQINYLGIDVAGSVMTDKENITLQCLLDSKRVKLEEGLSTYTLSYRWLYMPAPFSSLAYYLIFTSAMEFFSAQSPYSMKSFVMGLMYSSVAFSIAINVGLRHLYTFFPWSGSCITLYYSVSALITIFLVIIFLILSKWYSRRRRRDNEYEDISGERNINYYLYQ